VEFLTGRSTLFGEARGLVGAAIGSILPAVGFEIDEFRGGRIGAMFCSITWHALSALLHKSQ